MLPVPAGREASSGVGASVHVRHRPEHTLFYQLVQEYYPALKAHLAAQGTALLVDEVFPSNAAQTGAVTLIQRFGSALNLNIHFHMLFLDGVYVDNANGSSNRFQWVKAPTREELVQLVHSLAQRIGRKVFTLQTLPAVDPAERLTDTVGKIAGFSLHAGVAAKAHERKKLERLCRYVSRPAVSEKRLSLTPNGNIRYQLKTPYKDGTTHVIFEPPDFLARLSALVPKPRVNLTRFYSVFAPNSKHRAWVTPAKRGKGNKRPSEGDVEEPTPAERRASMTWAQRLKRVFCIDIEMCRECGGAVRIIACIEDPVVIVKILNRLDKQATQPGTGLRPENRAPPAGLFG